MSFYFTSLSGKVCEGARLCCWKTCHKFSRAETLHFQAEVSYREPVAVSLLSPVPLQLQRNPPPTTLQEPQEGVLFCFILEGTYFCVTLQWIMPAGRAGTGTGPTGGKPTTANALWEKSHECNGHGQLRGAMSAEKEGQTPQPGSPKSTPPIIVCPWILAPRLGQSWTTQGSESCCFCSVAQSVAQLGDVLTWPRDHHNLP